MMLICDLTRLECCNKKAPGGRGLTCLRCLLALYDRLQRPNREFLVAYNKHKANYYDNKSQNVEAVRLEH